MVKFSVACLTISRFVLLVGRGWFGRSGQYTARNQGSEVITPIFTPISPVYIIKDRFNLIKGRRDFDR